MHNKALQRVTHKVVLRGFSYSTVPSNFQKKRASASSTCSPTNIPRFQDFSRCCKIFQDFLRFFQDFAHGYTAHGRGPDAPIASILPAMTISLCAFRFGVRIGVRVGLMIRARVTRAPVSRIQMRSI